MSTHTAMTVRFNLHHEYLAIAKDTKYRGTFGIGTFIKHGGFPMFMRRPAMRELRSTQPSLLSPSIGQERMPS